jgi:hypothetical protein
MIKLGIVTPASGAISIGTDHAKGPIEFINGDWPELRHAFAEKISL